MKKIFLLLTSVIVLVLGWNFLRSLAPLSQPHPLDKKESNHQFVVAQAHTLLGFDLVDPSQAPLEIRDSVLRGYRLIMNTPFYAPNYSVANIACTNCHFAEGDTLGGKNNGLSLVGVSAVYPQFSKRDGKVITLADRINNCFMRSLNGNPLPKDSQEMNDIINYLNWISKEVMSLKHIPWLGVTHLKSQHKPDPQAGEKVYQTYCSFCHRPDGQGGAGEGIQAIPPLWGPTSFNDGAGMSMLPMLAAFVYWNMPYMEASLTEEEALDVAAFVLQQPRPHFHPKNP